MNRVQKVALTTGVLSLVAGALGGYIAGASWPSEDVVAGAGLAELSLATTTDEGTVERGFAVYESAQEALSVTDQLAGKRVSIATLTLSRPGWVAVREEVDGFAGSILGAQWFPAGSHSDVTVDLLRATVPGGRYHAYLFLDDGDVAFDHQKDAPITRNGLLVLAPFIAQ